MRSSKEIIDLITDIRKQRHISLSELARLSNISKSSLSRYENGSREFPVNKVNVFAKVLNVSPEYLLGIKSPAQSVGTQIASSNSDESLSPDDTETAKKRSDFRLTSRINKRKNERIQEIIDIVKDLDPIYQKRVYDYSLEQKENQDMLKIDTLAAHQADSTHVIKDKEASNIEKYLDDRINKFNGDK